MALIIFLNYNIDNFKAKYHKSYNSLFIRIKNSSNLFICQLYYNNIIFPSPLFNI